VLEKELGERFDERTQRFQALSQLTALRESSATEKPFVSNYNRGRLLFSLARKSHCTKALEFGTGRCFGLLSIAEAMQLLPKKRDSLDSPRIISVDLIGDGDLQNWPRIFSGFFDNSPMSRNDLFNIIPRPENIQLTFVKGTAFFNTEIIAKNLESTPELVFIDAGHGYWDVRADITALFIVLKQFRFNRGCLILFDDVSGKAGLGVAKAITRHLSKFIDPSKCHFLVVENYDERDDKISPHVMMLYDGTDLKDTLHNASHHLLTKINLNLTKFVTLLRLLEMKVRSVLKLVTRRK
jgi:hypothetical protein